MTRLDEEHSVRFAMIDRHIACLTVELLQELLDELKDLNLQER